MLTVRVGSDQNYEELLDSHLFSFVAYHLLILLLHELADRVISSMIPGTRVRRLGGFTRVYGRGSYRPVACPEVPR
jgi:hypothetical protein